MMTAANPVAKWSAWGPRLQSVLRIAAAFTFMLAGTTKLFAFPAGMRGGKTSARESER